MVDVVAKLGQPALGLTDHGNMAGAVQLYKACAKAGIKAFPGSELYIVADREDKKAKRHHLGVVAYTTEGYKNLVNLSTLSHRNFHNKPLIDHNDLAQLAEDGRTRGLAGLSGCVSGFVGQSLLRGDYHAAQQYLSSYAQWFDKFYVELMNHNITWQTEAGEITDDQLADQLVGLAQSLGLPCVLTQDSHYLRQADQLLHDSLKRLVSFGPDPDDAVFAGDGFQLADDAWIRQHHQPDRYDLGIAGLQDLHDGHDLQIASLDSYSYRIPFTVECPDEVLKSRCREELERRGLSTAHKTRLLEEIEIIRETEMAGYLVLAAEVTDWCRANSVVFQVRGSAAGSMVCWLMGITPVDPLKWKLGFERFISRDRTKPPDIDLDVEHVRRQELLRWLSERFAVSQIGNWGKNKLKGEVDPDTGEQSAKGSLRIQYYAKKRAAGDEIKDWSFVPEDDKALLYQLDELESYKGYGVNAAGIILTSSNQERDDLVPQMYVASSKTFVSQYDMNDIEDLGLVKLDVLGLKTLSVLHRCMDNLGRPVDLDWIPLNDRESYKKISKGDTDGIFQLEGWTARRGCKELQPTTIHDIIAAMALFRPATMDSGATKAYIQHKHHRGLVVQRHELLTTITKDTNHILLFQEQVISVLRQLGMGSDNLTKFLKAVKASNQNIGEAGKVIDAYKEQVRDMSVRAGMSDDDWEWLWQAITGFAAYGFNRAHSTVYGLTAYYCAYLAAHHPLEFHAALLAVAAGSDKEPDYVTATRKRDIRLLQPSLENSGITYQVERRNIRRGLTSIKGVGEKAATAILSVRPQGGFGTLDKFCELVDHRKITGVLAYRETGDLGVGLLNKLNELGFLEQLQS